MADNRADRFDRADFAARMSKAHPRRERPPRQRLSGVRRDHHYAFVEGSGVAACPCLRPHLQRRHGGVLNRDPMIGLWSIVDSGTPLPLR